MNAAASARPLAPRFILFASVALAWAALASFAPAGRVNTAACPVELPKPLRMMYLGSDRVVVARAVVSRRIEDSEYPDNQRRTLFDVSENLKGDPGENRVEVRHWVTGDPDYVGNFRKDETALLFLDRDDGGGYVIGDTRYGIKKGSEADLKIYVKRIEELSYIVNQPEDEQKAELLEWFVRCAEEPATRWEGAYELSVGQSSIEYEAERRKEAAQSAAPAETAKKEGAGAAKAGGDDSAPDAASSGGESAAEGGEEAAESGTVEVTADDGEGIVLSFGERLNSWGRDDNASVVKGLTAAHKKRLADALFASDKMGEGEMALLSLVKNWGDERFVPFVLRYLRGVEEEPPYEATEVVTALAHALKDDTLIKLAGDYDTLAPFYDEEETEGEQTPDDESGVNVGEADSGGGEEEAARGEDETPEVNAELKSLESARDADGKKLTAAQRRGRMLRYVLTAAEGRLSEAAQRAEQR